MPRLERLWSMKSSESPQCSLHRTCVDCMRIRDHCMWREGYSPGSGRCEVSTGYTSGPDDPHLPPPRSACPWEWNQSNTWSMQAGLQAIQDTTLWMRLLVLSQRLWQWMLAQWQSVPAWSMQALLQAIPDVALWSWLSSFRQELWQWRCALWHYVPTDKSTLQWVFSQLGIVFQIGAAYLTIEQLWNLWTLRTDIWVEITESYGEWIAQRRPHVHGPAIAAPAHAPAVAPAVAHALVPPVAAAVPAARAAAVRRPPPAVRECIVCMDGSLEILFRPCNHIVCCAACARDLVPRRCPSCRGHITGQERVFGL